MQTLPERLSDEADLCRNEGANDIARLLDEASRALAVMTSMMEGIEEITAEGYQSDYVSRLTEIRGRARWGLMVARGEG